MGFPDHCRGGGGLLQIIAWNSASVSNFNNSLPTENTTQRSHAKVICRTAGSEFQRSFSACPTGVLSARGSGARAHNVMSHVSGKAAGRTSDRPAAQWGKGLPTPVLSQAQNGSSHMGQWECVCAAAWAEFFHIWAPQAPHRHIPNSAQLVSDIPPLSGAPTQLFPNAWTGRCLANFPRNTCINKWPGFHCLIGPSRWALPQSRLCPQQEKLGFTLPWESPTKMELCH